MHASETVSHYRSLIRGYTSSGLSGVSMLSAGVVRQLAVHSFKSCCAVSVYNTGLLPEPSYLVANSSKLIVIDEWFPDRLDADAIRISLEYTTITASYTDHTIYCVTNKTITAVDLKRGMSANNLIYGLHKQVTCESVLFILLFTCLTFMIQPVCKLRPKNANYHIFALEFENCLFQL